MNKTNNKCVDCGQEAKHKFETDKFDIEYLCCVCFRHESGDDPCEGYPINDYNSPEWSEA
jgi:hypothetical protein